MKSWSLGHQEEDPQVMSCHGDTVRGWIQSPSQQKRCLTFAEGRSPSSSEDSPVRDARIEEAHQSPLPTWGDERVPDDDFDW